MRWSRVTAVHWVNPKGRVTTGRVSLPAVPMRESTSFSRFLAGGESPSGGAAAREGDADDAASSRIGKAPRRLWIIALGGFRGRQVSTTCSAPLALDYGPHLARGT